MQKIISRLERATKFIPKPVTMFVYMSMIVIIVSSVLFFAGLEWTDPASNVRFRAVNAFSKSSLQWLITNLISNFTGYMAYGPVITMAIAIGVCEETGLVSMLMRKAVSKTSDRMMPLLVSFVGVMSNIADNTSIFIITPLAGFAYLSTGRNPILGMITAYLANTSGMAANLLLTNSDVLCTGVTNEVLEEMGEGAQITVSCNWYFMAASCVLLTVTCYLVTEKILSKSLPPLSEAQMRKIDNKINNSSFTSIENKGLRKVLFAFLVYILLIIIGGFTGVLQDDSGIRFLWNNLVVISMGGFVFLGTIYGVTVGTVKNLEDIKKMAVTSVARMSEYTVLIFVISQFTNILEYSKLPQILAVLCSKFIKNIHAEGILLIFVFILLCSFLDIFMTSQVVKWSIVSPIAVPLFSNLGWSPALTQAAYRISDSAVNCMSPISPFLFMMIDISRDIFKCEDSDTSRWLSMLIPSSFLILIVWMLLLLFWILMDLPLGPESFIHS